jgi:hypothetical protein
VIVQVDDANFPGGHVVLLMATIRQAPQLWLFHFSIAPRNTHDQALEDAVACDRFLTIRSFV